MTYARAVRRQIEIKIVQGVKVLFHLRITFVLYYTLTKLGQERRKPDPRSYITRCFVNVRTGIHFTFPLFHQSKARSWLPK